MDDHTPYELLLIEDNPADMRLMEEAIRLSHLMDIVAVTKSYNAEQAFGSLEEKYTQRGVFHLALLDLNMPRTNGKDILRQLKADRRFARIPVLMLTNSDSPRDIAECMHLGATTYFQKPTDFNDLIGFFRAIRFSLETEHRILPAVIDKSMADSKKAA